MYKQKNDVKPETYESVVSFHSPDRRRILVYSTIIIVLIITIAGVIGYGLWHSSHKTEVASTQPAITANPKKVTATMLGPVLDANKKYGNKYADGKLPVGDGKYVTAAPKQGFVYACSNYAQSLTTDKGGAETRGPWFVNNNTQYDTAKKPHVLGGVTWKAEFTDTLNNETHTIVTNDLPSHVTGIFPIGTTDPAYQYDRNPNTIKGQALTFALASSPAYNTTPHCMSAVVGVMLTGVQLNSAFDAGGHDAGAWEVQDSCSGHPQEDGEYHYHTLSGCIKDVSVHTVIGYALDGFPITGPQVVKNNMLTTANLDECHGIFSSYEVDGKSVMGYHYVMTQDFPYSVSCFRASPIDPPEQQTKTVSVNPPSQQSTVSPVLLHPGPPPAK